MKQKEKNAVKCKLNLFKVISISAILFSFVNSSQAQVTLVKEGKAEAVVIISDKPTETARYAADELVKHVRLATGISLKIETETGASEEMHTRIYVPGGMGLTLVAFPGRLL
jgi:hypothetical protein